MNESRPPCQDQFTHSDFVSEQTNRQTDFRTCYLDIGEYVKGSVVVWETSNLL